MAVDASKPVALIVCENGRWRFDLYHGSIIFHEGYSGPSKLDAIADRDRKVAKWVKAWDEGEKNALTKAAKFCVFLTKG